MSEAWFDRKSLSVRVPLTDAERSGDKIAYYYRFSHEYLHFLDIVGTSFGQFLLNLDAIRALLVTQLTRLLGGNQILVRMPLREWARTETLDKAAAVAVRECTRRYELCARIEQRLSDNTGTEAEAGLCEDLRRLMLLEAECYPHLCGTGQLTNDITAQTPLSPSCPPSQDQLGGSDLLECRAKLVQWLLVSQLLPSLDKSLASLREQDRGMYQALVDSPTSANDVAHEVQGTFYGQCRRTFEAVQPELPGGTLAEQVFTLLVLSDLALMTPLGSLYHSCWKKPLVAWSDLAPGLRILYAAITAKQLGLGLVEDVERDYLPYTRAVCEALDWPHPLTLAKHAIAELPRSSTPGFNWVRQALQLRCEAPAIFALPRKRLYDSLLVPITILNDKIYLGCTQEEYAALVNQAFVSDLASRLYVGESLGDLVPRFMEHLPGANDADASAELLLEDMMRKSFGVGREGVLPLRSQSGA